MQIKVTKRIHDRETTQIPPDSNWGQCHEFSVQHDRPISSKEPPAIRVSVTPEASASHSASCFNPTQIEIGFLRGRLYSDATALNPGAPIWRLSTLREQHGRGSRREFGRQLRSNFHPLRQFPVLQSGSTGLSCRERRLHQILYIHVIKAVASHQRVRSAAQPLA